MATSDHGHRIHRLFEVARETGDEVLIAYANDALRGEDWDDLVFRMMRTFAENRRYILEAYRKSIMDRSVLIKDIIPLDEFSKAGVKFDEWAAAERAIIDNGDVYFVDFLRSLWRRAVRRVQKLSYTRPGTK